MPRSFAVEFQRRAVALVRAGKPITTRPSSLGRVRRLLGVSSPGYCTYKNRVLSPTQMRRQWLTGLIREGHTASRHTYGSRRVPAKLTLGMGVRVSERLVAVLMSQARIAGLFGAEEGETAAWQCDRR